MRLHKIKWKYPHPNLIDLLNIKRIYGWDVPFIIHQDGDKGIIWEFIHD